MNGGILYLSHMLSHYVQLFSGTHVYLEACSNMRELLHAYLVGLEALDLFLPEPLMHHLSLCALTHNNGSDLKAISTLCIFVGDPMCVQAANALVRLCICPGSSELWMFA